MSKNKKYLKPEADIVFFQNADIITISIGDGQIPIVGNGVNDEEEI